MEAGYVRNVAGYRVELRDVFGSRLLPFRSPFKTITGDPPKVLKVRLAVALQRCNAIYRLRARSALLRE